MKLQVLQDSFAKALNNASRFTTVKAQLPVLGNIKLHAKKEKLNLLSTNLEISTSITIGGKVEEEGEVAVPSRIITEIVNNLPGGTISLESSNEQLKISSGEYSSSLMGMNTSDFPAIPQKISSKDFVTLPLKDFSEGLSQVVFAASVDETRPILTGVLMFTNLNSLLLVGTDGFRLSQKIIKLKEKIKLKKTVVPKNILNEIGRFGFENDQIQIEINENENQIVFESDSTTLSSRLIEGEFPDYDRIIPKSSQATILVDKEELLRAVKLSSIFARDSANVVKIKVLKDSISFSAESQSAGNQKTKIDAQVKGEIEGEIAFNFRFMEEFIHSVKGEIIEIKLKDPNSPGVFTDPKDESYLHLIMPVKIQE